jgi:hypothetical protein
LCREPQLLRSAGSEEEGGSDTRLEEITYLFLLCSSSDIIGMIKSRRIKLAEHVALGGREKKSSRVLVRNPEETSCKIYGVEIGNWMY